MRRDINYAMACKQTLEVILYHHANKFLIILYGSLHGSNVLPYVMYWYSVFITPSYVVSTKSPTGTTCTCYDNDNWSLCKRTNAHLLLATEPSCTLDCFHLWTVLIAHLPDGVSPCSCQPATASCNAASVARHRASNSKSSCVNFFLSEPSRLLHSSCNWRSCQVKSVLPKQVWAVSLYLGL